MNNSRNSCLNIIAFFIDFTIQNVNIFTIQLVNTVPMPYGKLTISFQIRTLSHSQIEVVGLSQFPFSNLSFLATFDYVNLFHKFCCLDPLFIAISQYVTEASLSQ